MSPQAERRIGTIIGGKWRVDALLGSGSMAAVYGVTHRNGARAALKILHPTLCTDPAVCERFLGEGYLANSVKHPGIVRVLDDGVTDDGCVFLTMDLLEGVTLEDLRQQRGGRVPVLEALDLGDKLLDVLSAVHAVGIIHRDLKPQNVFICTDGELKLLDFGVARVFDRTSQSKLSMFGLVLGTPSFMSPEQAMGSRNKVDHRSDIWSFGATLFTALTGETVHLGANIQARLLAAATIKARSIALVNPDLPSALASVIDTSLQFKKEDRWPSVDALRRALREARGATGLEPVEAPPDLARGASVARMRPSIPAAALPALSPRTGPDAAPRHSSAPQERPTAESPTPAAQVAAEGTFIGIGDRAETLSATVGHEGSLSASPVLAPAPPSSGGISASERLRASTESANIIAPKPVAAKPNHLASTPPPPRPRLRDTMDSKTYERRATRKSPPPPPPPPPAAASVGVPKQNFGVRLGVVAFAMAILGAGGFVVFKRSAARTDAAARARIQSELGTPATLTSTVSPSFPAASVVPVVRPSPTALENTSGIPPARDAETAIPPQPQQGFAPATSTSKPTWRPGAKPPVRAPRTRAPGPSEELPQPNAPTIEPAKPTPAGLAPDPFGNND